jgi:hypothetical protein
MGGPTYTHGTAFLTHDGPPGAVLADATIIDTVNGTVQPLKFQAVREIR